MITASACFTVPLTDQVSRKLSLLLCPRGNPITSVEDLCFVMADMHWCPERGISLSVEKTGLLCCKREIAYILCCLLCLNGLKHKEPDSACSSYNVVNSILFELELLLF